MEGIHFNRDGLRAPTNAGTRPDDAQLLDLETRLKGLGHARRLRLLHLLREPKSLDEILLTPGPAQAGARPLRPISRQAVEHHLRQLVALGVVRVQHGNGKQKRNVRHYVLDQARVYGIVEALREVAQLKANVALELEGTVPAPAVSPASWEPGPRLVLVHGARAGQAFPLRADDLQSPRGWIIGRAAQAHVRLDYDPFVSSENAEILRDGSGFRLLDMRTSKNGTFLNFQRMKVGADEPLVSGSIIGVGGSLLVFQES